VRQDDDEKTEERRQDDARKQTLRCQDNPLTLCADILTCPPLRAPIRQLFSMHSVGIGDADQADDTIVNNIRRAVRRGSNEVLHRRNEKRGERMRTDVEKEQEMHELYIHEGSSSD